jgi:uncharacterized protein with HEPN domain
VTRTLKASLQDILQFIQDIDEYRAGADPGFHTLKRMNYDALLYSLLKITEAVRQIPDDIRAKRPDLVWRDIERTGNLLRHRYFRVERSIIADIVHNDLPALKYAVERFWRDLGYGDLPKLD